MNVSAETSLARARDFFRPIGLWVEAPNAPLAQALTQAPPVLKNLESAFDPLDGGLMMSFLGEQPLTPEERKAAHETVQNLVDLAGVASAYMRRQVSLQKRPDLIFDRDLWLRTLNHLPLMGPSQFTKLEFHERLQGMELATKFLEAILGVVAGGPLLAAFRAFLGMQGETLRVRFGGGHERVQVGMIAVVLGREATGILKPMLKGFFADFSQQQRDVSTTCFSSKFFDLSFSYQTATSVFNYRALENPLIRDDFERLIHSTQIDDIQRAQTFFDATKVSLGAGSGAGRPSSQANAPFNLTSTSKKGGRTMSVADAASAQLKQQVEQIIDQGDGERRSVIVQMRSDGRVDQKLINVAAEVHRRRNLTLTARELLPEQEATLRKLTEASPQELARNVEHSASLASNIGAALDSSTFANLKAQLRKEGERALQPLDESELVQKAMDETIEIAGRRRNVTISRQEAPRFWSSNSMVLNIGVDDLAKLPKQVPQIRQIFPNHTLRLPRLAHNVRLPQAVQDDKTSSWGINRIGALATWGAYGGRGRGVKVAVLDTGVDAEHPDLKSKVTAWAEFTGNGVEVPGSRPHDTSQHGTHCAGIIAGGNASNRWIGVAPEVELAAALVLNGDEGKVAQILAGIQWAIDQGVDVISMSLGGLVLDVEPPDPYTEALLSAISAGIVVVTAIGNDGNQTTGSPGNDWFSFSVGATDHRDQAAAFSGGRTHVLRRSRFLAPQNLPLVYSKPEVSAPGVAVTSSVPGGGWASFNGTSMSAPHVAGAVALLLSNTNIKQSVVDTQRAFLVQDLLAGAVEELGEAGQDHRFGFGRVDVLRAIGYAKELGY